MEKSYYRFIIFLSLIILSVGCNSTKKISEKISNEINDTTVVSAVREYSDLSEKEIATHALQSRNIEVVIERYKIMQRNDSLIPILESRTTIKDNRESDITTNEQNLKKITDSQKMDSVNIKNDIIISSKNTKKKTTGNGFLLGIIATIAGLIFIYLIYKKIC